MMRRTFRHGTHPPANKITQNIPLAEFPVPERVYISLSQHIGAPAKAAVSAGERVLEGQLIAEAGGFVSAPVFSSVSGTVKGICKLPSATGVMQDHIEIENDFLYEKTSLAPIDVSDPRAVAERIKDAGIVGMGGAAFPAHVKYSPSNEVDTLIINAAECEPYITCDCRLLLEHTAEVLEGVRLAALVLGAKNVYVGIETNKPDAIKKLIAEAGGSIKIVPLKTKYPQGAEKQLIYSVTRRVVPSGGLPAAVGCVVSNVHTVYAIARAVKGEPLYKRAMTVGGLGVEKAGNYWVRTGVPYSFIYDELRGSRAEEDTRKVISGGPMMGFAQADLRPVVTKATSSLLFLTEKEFSEYEPTQCINCGRCVRHCPMNLMPKDIEHAVLKKDFEAAFALGVNNCMECGVCSYSCPAKRPLVQAMRLAKKTVRERGIK